MDRTLQLAPGRGYLEALAGVSSNTGPFARAEAGWRPRENLAAFAFGQWRPGESMAGVGARVTW